jgi:L-rhamnose isomerase
VAEVDIPAEIRRVLLDRLTEVLEALEHLGIGGPNAVRKAAEALAISAVLYEEESGNAHSVFQKIKQTAKVTWVALTIATQLATAVLTWDKIVDLPALGAGTEQRQLPPGPQPPADQDRAEK